MSLHLDDRVTALSGVGPKLAGKLVEAFEIQSIRDLLEHYPRRYHDAGEVMDLSEVELGQPATLLGEVLEWDRRRVPPRGKRRALDVTTAQVRQASGAVFRATFFNQKWRPKQLAPGTVAAFSGKVKRFREQLELTTPDVQLLGRVGAGVDTDEAAARLRHQQLLAVYPAVGTLPSFKINEMVQQALEQLPPFQDWLPEAWRRERGLLGLDEAMRAIHQPVDRPQADAARTRLVFDELLTLQLGLQARRAALEAEVVGVSSPPQDGELAARFLQKLPFGPTFAQNVAFGEIGEDLAASWPMHRLLQGDVGSGKTLVAVWSMLCAVDSGHQAALMVPTEVLADQHHRTLCDLLAPLGVNVLDGVRVELLTSSTTQTQRRRILGELLSGDVDLIVGTHALLEEGVRFADLGLVVIDEQHRFGVSQRVRLKEKGAASSDQQALPDVLVMTATPIPRSLALTLYGDLDVTTLDELPPGRQPIKTQLITTAEAARRDKVYDFIRSEAQEGRRAFIVCPFVEPSETVPGTAVTVEHERLKKEVFPDLDVELVHGQMGSDARERAMKRFRHGEAQVLVTTTVIEVGVDIPEASVIVIEDAERFGISQLHQLRGRVGRGQDRSFCVLFAGWNVDAFTDDAQQRLRAVADSTDGFALAEADLEIRGEGELFGSRQSGLPDLKLTRLLRDVQLVASTRKLASQVIADDAALSAPEHAGARAEVLRRYEGGIAAFAAMESG